MNTPKISVVMSVYNGMPFLKEAVQSILNQTYKDFEFIIVDDASTDGTWKYLNSLQDQRIKLIKNSKNLGLASSLNIGMKAAKGEYIARMDADDISLPDRFEKEAHFLNSHKDYVLVGSQVQWVSEHGEPIDGFDVPQSDDEIRKKFIIRNQIHHATVMFRKSIVSRLGLYRAFLNGVEDYDLWFRIMNKGKVFNLPERLERRRVHPKAVTKVNHLKVELLALIVRIINLPKIV